MTFTISIEAVERGYAAWLEADDVHTEGYGDTPAEAAHMALREYETKIALAA